MIVVDTNVLSELTKLKPFPEVVAWFHHWRIPDLFTSAITNAEIQMGIHLMPKGRRRDVLQRGASWANVRREVRHGRSVLPQFEFRCGAHSCFINGGRRRLGRPIEIMDAQIAAIALSHRAVIATRDA